MNILLINHYAGSPKHGMEFRPYYLAREWVMAGHQVQIVAASHSHIRAQQPQLDHGQVKDELIDGIGYRWYSTPIYTGNGLGRVVNMLSFMHQLWRDANELANGFKPDVVIASSTYPMDIWPARRVACLAKARLVYEVHDLWPLSPMELGGLSRWHPFIMWVQWAEDYAYMHSHKVVSMLPKTQEHMISRGMAPEKWVYVPNGVDLTEWQSPVELPVDVQTAIDAMKVRGLPIIGYTGTHGLSNALDVLLDAAALLKGQAQFLMVGTGPERDRLLKRVANEGLDNVIMLPSVQKPSIPYLLEQIDVAYIGWHPNPLYRFGISPNKLMDYMMAARPIVHSVDAGNDPVQDAGCGLSVRPNDVEAVAAAIRELCNMPREERLVLGAKGRQFAVSNRLYPTLANDFLFAVASKC
jgi:glycosyltransferase involved in cell wall biosynthesis